MLQRNHFLTLFSRLTWVALGYLILLSAAESLVVLGLPHLGLLLHGLILAALFLFASLVNQSSQRQFLLALTLAPLVRILSLTIPLTLFPNNYWYLVVGGPLFISVFLITRQAGITRQMTGLVIDKISLQLLVGLSGLIIGYAEYKILGPDPLVPALRWELIWLPALILLIFTGLLEELIFRGLMQSTATLNLGHYAIPYIAGVYAMLHLGYRSALDVVFVFGVGLFFGWIVKWSGSILGVSLAHGLTNISLYLVLPFLLEEPTAIKELLLPSKPEPYKVFVYASKSKLSANLNPSATDIWIIVSTCNSLPLHTSLSTIQNTEPLPVMQIPVFFMDSILLISSLDKPPPS